MRKDSSFKGLTLPQIEAFLSSSTLFSLLSHLLAQYCIFEAKDKNAPSIMSVNQQSASLDSIYY